MPATIIAKQSLNGIEILKTDTSPVSGGGLAAPIGSQANAEDGSGLAYKFGAGDTDWVGNTSLLARKIPILKGELNIYNTYSADTRMMFPYSTAAAFNATSNNALSQTPVNYSIISTDYPTIGGITPKFRLRAMIGVNNTAPAINILIGLFPITTPASSGGITVKSWTIGTEVSNSTITQNTPAANTQYQLVGTTFALPADGLYTLCVTNSGVAALNSYVEITAVLEAFY